MYIRKGNLKFKVIQKNSEQKLVIDDLIKSVDRRGGGDFFGYEKQDLQGKDIREVFPDSINEIIDDNLEFTYEGYDLKDVLEKVINLKILNKNNQEVDVNVHVERDVSEDENITFDTVFDRRIFLKEKIKGIVSSIAEVQQITHDKTGLMNAKTFRAVLDEVMDFLYESKYNSVFLVFSLEGYPTLRRQYGKAKSDEILSRISYVVKSNFRGRDICAYLGMGKFGVFMINTFEDEVQYPLQRLRDNLRKEGVLSSKVSFNARYQNVDLELKVDDLLDSIMSKKVDYTINN